MYQNVLGRYGDSAGVTYWTGQLDQHTKSRGEVMSGFSESHEHKIRRAGEVNTVDVFFGMLRRVPTAAELTTWVPLHGDVEARADHRRSSARRLRRTRLTRPPVDPEVAGRCLRAQTASDTAQKFWAERLRRPVDRRSAGQVSASAALRSALIASAKPSAMSHTSGTVSRSAMTPKFMLPMFDSTVMLMPAPSSSGPNG